MLIIQHHGTNTPITYKHSVQPIKTAQGFEPNMAAFNKVKSASVWNIFEEDFVRFQKAGKTLLVNQAGGWCELTYGMDILEGQENLK